MANKRSVSENGKNGGNSRAAKKRAKQKEKQHLKTQNSKIAVAITTSTANDEGGKKESIDCKADYDCNHQENEEEKLQLPLGDEEDNDGIKEINTRHKGKKKKMKKKNEKSVTEKRDYSFDAKQEEEEEGRGDDDDDEKILDKFLACLTPAEILFPEKFVSESVESNGEDKETKAEQPDPLTFVSNITTEKRAHVLFSALLMPSGLSTDAFYKHYWEKKPLLISMSENMAEPDSKGTIYGEDLDLDEASQQAYQHRFDGFISKKGIEKMISQTPVKYGRDINVTNYCNSVGGKRRVTLDQLPDMSNNNIEEVEFIDAESDDIWSNFKSGCTLRLLCPQVRI